jgi:16S rRNA (uracil1498-N3)-methyltransferase
MIARRTDAHLAAASAKRVERWRRLALQAAEQSRRTVPPEVAVPLKLKDAVDLPGAARILLAEAEQQVLLRDVLDSHPDQGEILLAIGPEDGLTTKCSSSRVRAGFLLPWAPQSCVPKPLPSLPRRS